MFYTLTYDALGRPVTVNDLWAKTPTFTYDAAGNRTKVRDSDGGATTSTYDANRRLTRRESNNTNQFRVDLTYTAAGQTATINRYKDLNGANNVAYSTYTYDAAGHVTNLHHRKGTDNSTIANYTYTYDAGSAHQP